MNVRRKRTARRIANDRGRPGHLIADPVEHPTTDAGHGRIQPLDIIAMHDHSSGEICIQFHGQALIFTKASTACLRRRVPVFVVCRIVVQVGGQPAFGDGELHTLTKRIILDLVAFDLADTEIACLRMGEIEPAH